MEKSKSQRHASPQTPKYKNNRHQTGRQIHKSKDCSYQKRPVPTSMKASRFDGTAKPFDHSPPRSPTPKVHFGHHSSYSSPYSSDSDSFEATTPPRNSFLAENVYRKAKHDVSPRGVSRETTPELMSEEEVFFKRSSQRNTTKDLYAGPTFSNAPTPDALPVPAFVDRTPRPRNIVYTLSTSTHSQTEQGLNLSPQFSPNECLAKSYEPDNDLRLRSQKLLNLLNGGNNEPSPKSHYPTSNYLGVYPPPGQQYQPFGFPFYQGLASDSYIFPESSVYVPA
ncbi:hypothetical protein K493DRAFT_319089 [Basidiobolus meristosporus CBS 931.73]|uniref:Uncharacterized protein n=1 Tax=Basidiobolus meristosporus CBS 931.73 TaxID=1314790 RepID=A0A1Y1XT66_9FUNG|nr:hypothetical protein K493DRAFT_319089 [Basidiobolus meristosporus CBS 931.73]|eukprot:ORX88930.1 hypothetical protein K493DRAFT_319089 [Basidiobolus meristosporus CBS 931.73]